MTGLAAARPNRVKSGKTQAEHIMSAVASIADVRRCAACTKGCRAGPIWSFGELLVPHKTDSHN